MDYCRYYLIICYIIFMVHLNFGSGEYFSTFIPDHQNLLDYDFYHHGYHFHEHDYHHDPYHYHHDHGFHHDHGYHHHDHGHHHGHGFHHTCNQQALPLLNEVFGPNGGGGFLRFSDRDHYGHPGVQITAGYKVPETNDSQNAKPQVLLKFHPGKLLRKLLLNQLLG